MNHIIQRHAYLTFNILLKLHFIIKIFLFPAKSIIERILFSEENIF